MSLAEMRKIVENYLPLFDEILAKRLVSITQRPFEAAALFVSEVIVEIEGQDKDAFWDKQWFADIYSWTEIWYQTRYGESMGRRDDDCAQGVVELFDTSFSLRIPLTVTRPHIPGESVRLTFPTSVMDGEDVLGWFEQSPNIQALTERELGDLTNNIEQTATKLRTIHVNILSADFESPTVRRLAGSIEPHLNRAAEELLSSKAERLAYSNWEMHLAVEKLIKVFLRQREVEPPKIHDLNALHRLAESHGAPASQSSPIAWLPESQNAIGSRYGENETTLANALHIYTVGLGVVENYSEALRRSLGMKDATFYLKMPPWKSKSLTKGSSATC